MSEEKEKTKRGTNMKPKPPDPSASIAFYTTAEVAFMLRKSYQYVARAAGTPALPKPARIGRTIQWPRKKFDAWIEAGCPRGAK